MSTKTVTISMPLYIRLSKKESGKKYHLNMNNYRNWHFQASNNLKEAYKNIAVEMLEDAPIIRADRVSILYTLYRGDKKKFDLMNILSVHDKFFSDALVWLGCIPDDDVNCLSMLQFRFGGYDIDNPRVEIAVTMI